MGHKCYCHQYAQRIKKKIKSYQRSELKLIELSAKDFIHNDNLLNEIDYRGNIYHMWFNAHQADPKKNLKHHSTKIKFLYRYSRYATPKKR